LIAKFFPSAFRATIHPKKDQLALVQSGASYPWNGVAWSEKWPQSTDDISVKPISALCDEGAIVKVEFSESGLPAFFYKASDIQSSRLVLSPSGWELRGLIGRPFMIEDADIFLAAGVADTNYSWEREPKDQQYFRNLMKFRMEHHNKYGFGVNGVWEGTEFVGQFGLQVLSEKDDQVEFVIFLREKYTRQGLGKILSDYLIEECKRWRMKYLFGVVRPENLGAIKLLEKHKAKKVRETKHFGHQALVYRIDLRSA